MLPSRLGYYCVLVINNDNNVHDLIQKIFIRKAYISSIVNNSIKETNILLILIIYKILVV